MALEQPVLEQPIRDRDFVSFMNGKGDEVKEYDPTDPESTKWMKSQIDPWLKKGYWLLGRLKGGGLEVITKDQIDDEKYTAILLSKNYRKLVQPPPSGG